MVEAEKKLIIKLEQMSEPLINPLLKNWNASNKLNQFFFDVGRWFARPNLFSTKKSESPT